MNDVLNTVRCRGLSLALGVALLASAGLSGCANVASPVSGSSVQRVDPGTVSNSTLGYDATDLNLIAEKMTQSLLESPALNGRPTLAVATVKNKTGEYIDTNNILNTIQTQVMKSGKVRFTRSTGELGGAVEQLGTTNNSGLYDKKTAPKIVPQQGGQPHHQHDHQHHQVERRQDAGAERRYQQHHEDQRRHR